MLSTSSINALLGAAIIGIIGAAAMYLVDSNRQKKMRHEMTKDLAQLNQELSEIKRDLSELLVQTAQQSVSRPRRRTNARKAYSIISNSTDDYLSACNMDSSDVSGDEDNENTTDFKDILNETDTSLDIGTLGDFKRILEKLNELCEKYDENSELLCRLEKAHHKISYQLDQSEKTTIQDHIAQGIDACAKALELKEDSADIHKWYAILTVCKSDLAGLQQKIADGDLFKKHVDRVLELNPQDASLHHMLGRFDYEVASLKCYDRKAAAALFSEPPNATYEQALEHFLDAEKLVNYEWKANRLMIAKCHVAMGNSEEAVEWLMKADGCKGDLDKIDEEIKSLLQKHNPSR